MQLPHEELAQLVLEESGYIDMWKAERTPDAAGRLDNLKELVRSMGEFPDLGSFLEHVSLVMDAESGEEGERVSIMTLHAAKGLEFDVVFLPGWEEGLFPHQRSLDDNGLAGLEEERRLAYVGLTRARRQAQDLLRPQPADPRALAGVGAIPVHPGIARGRMSSSRNSPVRPIAAMATGRPPGRRPRLPLAMTRPAGAAPRRGRAKRASRARGPRSSRPGF